MTAVDLQRGLITIADPSRLIPGNERYFDESGVVLAGPYTGQAGYHPELKKVYQMRIHDFLPHWYDQRVPPQPGRYEQTFIWVDLASRR